MSDNELLARLEAWLDEDPAVNMAEIEIGQQSRWCVRLMQSVARDEENPFGERCVADAEAATFQAAVEGALTLAAEFKEGHG